MAVSIAGFAGYWLHLHYTKKFGSKDPKRVEQLEEAVAELESQVQDLTAHMQERLEHLHERVDFAERLLTDRPQLPVQSEEPTPA